MTAQTMIGVLAGVLLAAGGGAGWIRSTPVPGVPAAGDFERRIAELESALAEREAQVERLDQQLWLDSLAVADERREWARRLAAAQRQSSDATGGAAAAMAEAQALRARAKRELRLAKESLGRALQLIDEAKLMGRAAEQGRREAEQRALDARRAEEAWRAAEAAAAERERELDELRRLRPTGFIWGGYGCSVGPPPLPRDPWAATRHLGPTRIPRTGTGSDLPSPLRGIPVRR